LDALQTATFAGLICMALAPYLIWIWHFKGMIKIRLQGDWNVIRRMNLKDALLIILLFPFALTGGLGALWLYVKGWEEFTRTITICIEFGFISGALIASIMFIFNQIGLYIAKKRKYRIQE
jgi:hypothetical protein